MKSPRYIVDTTLRDGEQCAGVVMSAAQKLAVAQLLERCGVYQIEAGTPALGSCEIESVCAVMEKRRSAKIATWNRMKQSDVIASFACRPDIIHISAPVSLLHIQKKLRQSPDWVEKRLCECVELATSHGYEVTVGFEDASRASVPFMARLANAVGPLGVRRVRFADTVGIMTPVAMGERIALLKESCGAEIQVHAHNDLGMAIGNTLRSAMAGAMYLDTTLGGISERAGGCDHYGLAVAAEPYYDIGADASAIREASLAAQRILWSAKNPGTWDGGRMAFENA